MPLTVVALVAGVGKIFLTLLWPSAAHAWAAGAVLPILWMRHAVDGLDRLPGATVAIPPFSIGLLIAYYALFALLFIPIRRKRLEHPADFVDGNDQRRSVDQSHRPIAGNPARYRLRGLRGG